MKISNILVKKVNNEGSVKGYASLTLNDQFAIHNIRIIEGKKGMFVAMPSRKVATGEYKDICHPVTNDLREEFSKQILDAYNKLEKNVHE